MEIQPSFENVPSQNIEVDAKPEEMTDTIDLVMGLFSPTDQSQEHQKYQERVEEQKTLSTPQINGPVTDIEVTKTVSRASKESADISGESFVEWLKAGITGNIFAINNPSAKLHIVKGQLFLVTPGIFQMFFNSKGITDFTKKDIETLQYSFQALKLHKKYHHLNNDSINFWRCQVIGPRKISQLIGYLIEKTDYFFGSRVPIDNLHLSLIEENYSE